MCLKAKGAVSLYSPILSLFLNPVIFVSLRVHVERVIVFYVSVDVNSVPLPLSSGLLTRVSGVW